MGQPSIVGLITAMDGTPLHDIRIEVHSVTNGTVTETSYSNAVGNFEVYNLRPGAYEVIAQDGVNEAREEFTFDGTANNNIILRMRKSGSVAPRKGTVSVVELRTPEKARNLAERARNAISKNRLQDAEKFVASALAIAPDYPNALTLRAVLKLNSNQAAAALEDLDHAIKTDPTYAPAYLALGSAFNQMGRFDEALRSLDRDSMYDPQSWQCAFEMSKSWLGKQDYQHALNELNRAQSLSGNRLTMPIHLLRGYALMGQKMFAQAATEFQAFLSSDPNGPMASSVRATLARIQTEIAQKPDTLTLPKMSGIFAQAQ